MRKIALFILGVGLSICVSAQVNSMFQSEMQAQDKPEKIAHDKSSDEMKISYALMSHQDAKLSPASSSKSQLTLSSLSFHVDMSYQIQLGAFNPAIDFVDLAGTFNNWGNPGTIMSDADGDGIYSVLIDTLSVGDTLLFKFRLNANWNTAEFPGGDNRSHVISQPVEDIYYLYNDEYPTTETSIVEIQSNADALGASNYDGQIVATSGVVTAVDYNGYFLQDGEGAWTGIYVYDPYHSPTIGEYIYLAGEVDEYYGLTEIKNLILYSAMLGSTPNVTQLTSSELSNSEAYESVYVIVQNATCTSGLNTNNQWIADDGSGMAVVEDDIYLFTPTVGNSYNIKGVVKYSYSEYKLYPRAASDVVDITGMATVDAALLSLDLGSDYYELGASNMALFINLSNTGALAINNFELNYSFDGGAIYSDYTDQQIMFAGDTSFFRFDHQSQFSTVGMHTIDVWISAINGQLSTSTDTVSYTFEVIDIQNRAYANTTYPFRSLVTFDLAYPDKVVILELNVFDNEFISDGTWYNNQYLGVKRNSNELVYVEPLFGSHSVVGQFTDNIRLLTYDNSNDLMYGFNSWTGDVYQVDPTNAALTWLSNIGTGFNAVACDQLGVVYGVNFESDSLYTINPVSGVLNGIGSIGFDAYYSQGMNFDHNTGTLYMTAFPTSLLYGQLRAVNVTTGATALVDDMSYGAQYLGLVIPHNLNQNQPGDYALKFDGYDDLLKIYNEPGTLPQNDFTLEVWVKPNAFNGVHELLYWWGNSDGVQFRVNANGTVLYGESGSGNWEYIISNTSLIANSWTHLALTKEDSICTMYMNAQVVASGIVNLGISPENMNIGGRDWSYDRFFNGELDDVRIWDVARSQSEIQNNMCPLAIANETTLKYWWQFNEGPNSMYAYDEKEDAVHVLQNMNFAQGADCSWVYRTCVLPPARDIGISELLRPYPENADLLSTSNEPVEVLITNYGTDMINELVDVTYQLNGGTLITEQVQLSLNPMQNQSYVLMQTMDLSQTGAYSLSISTVMINDEDASNDNISASINVNEILRPAYAHVYMAQFSLFDLTAPETEYFFGEHNSIVIKSGTWINSSWYAVTYNTNFLVKINPTSGMIDTIGLLDHGISGMSFDYSTGSLYALNFADTLYTIDTLTAATTLIGAGQGIDGFVSLACDANGDLYALNIYDDNLYAVDPLNATATSIGYVGFDAGSEQDMEFDHSTGELFMAAYNVNTAAELRVVDKNTGNSILINSFANGNTHSGFAIPSIPGNSVPTIVSTSPEMRNVVLEVFGGYHAGYDPDGHLVADGIAALYPGDVSIINFHQGGYAIPNTGEPDFRTAYGDSIAFQTELVGYPAGTINRQFFQAWAQNTSNPGTAMNRYNWQAASAIVLADQSYVNVAAEAEIDMTTNMMHVLVEIYYTGNSLQATNRLNVAIIQNNVEGPQIGGANLYPQMVLPNGNYLHQHMLRDLITGQWGELISNPIAGEFYSFEYNYLLPADYIGVEVDPTEIQLVAFVSENTQDVESGITIDPTLINFASNNDAAISALVLPDEVCGNLVDLNFELQNMAGTDLITAEIGYSINGGDTSIYGWNGFLSALQSEQLTVNDAGFLSGTINSVNIFVLSVNGVMDENALNDQIVGQFNAAPESYSTIHLVLVTDNYGSETTWEVIDDAGIVYSSGGPYSDSAPQLVEDVDIVLPALGCYSFQIYDAYGDGIDAGFGVGYYTITDSQGNAVLNGGQFTSMESKPFEVTTITGAISLVADFYCDTTMGMAPLSVNFFDISTGGPLNWLWDFGDGTTSTDQFPSHIYQTAGTYTVSLLVANSTSADSITFIDHIVVSAQPTPPGWNTTITGSNHTILIPDNAMITIGGNPIGIGDYIGVFYDSLGTPACGGMVMYEGITVALTAWGAQTGLVDGFASGESFSWKIYDMNAGIEYNAVADYDVTNFSDDEYYVANGMSGILSLGTGNLYPNWNYSITGANHSILVPVSANMVVDGDPIVSGDYLGVFYIDDNGDLACGGYQLYDGGSTAVSAWGDDSQTTSKDGFAPNETFIWKIWKADTDQEHMATATYMIGFANQGDFVANGLSGLESLSSSATHELYLISGWNMISTYMDPTVPLMDSLFAPVIANVEIVKNYLGQVFWPAWNVNLIGDHVVGQGYQIRMSSADTLFVNGVAVTPELAPIALPQGWAVIAYLRQMPGDIEIMLQSISNELEIVKNNFGQIYWPQYGVNLIGNMIPGQGYQLRMFNAATLTYPANLLLLQSEYVQTPNCSHYQHLRSTDATMSLMIPLSSWLNAPQLGAEIGVFSENGHVVGSAVFNGQNTAITIWGDDELTAAQEGLQLNDQFTLKLWEEGEEQYLFISNWHIGNDVYQKNKIAVVGTIRPEHNNGLTLYQNYPNPFTTQTRIEIYLPEDAKIELSVYNVIGEKLQTILDKELDAGEHQVDFNNENLPVGTYYYQLRSRDKLMTMKMVKF